MENQYISIKEFASAVGVTQQAVYKQLNNKLKPYLKVVENKKMLDISALELFSKKEELNQVEQPVQQQFNDKLNEKLIEMLQKELEEKGKQLAEKDKQIAELQSSLKEAHNLLSQEQTLHGIASKRILELEDKMAEADQEQNQEVEEPIVKKKWWQIFK